MPLARVKQTRCHFRPYFGRTLGSPPGLPGGGITGILPASGVGARICGSTLDGGHSVPSDLASLSPSASWDSPTVVRSVLPVPFGGIGAQLAGCDTAGGAVCGGGVAGEAGACACAALASISAQEARMNGFMVIR